LSYIAACRAKLLHRRIGVLRDSLERGRVEPIECSLGTGVGILSCHDVRPVGEKSTDLGRRALNGIVVPVEDGKRCTCHRADYPVDLPVAENLLIPGLRLLPPWQGPLITKYE